MSKQTQVAQLGNSPLSYRNKIINGHFIVDQRAAGANSSVTANTASYVTDQWQAAGVASDGVFSVGVKASSASVLNTTGHTNYLNVSVGTADASIASGQVYYVAQPIEGIRTADLLFGSANAKTCTLSFWVNSTVNGTFGGAIQNSGRTRCYPFTYTINATNTWEYKTVTIPGDTSGTWSSAAAAVGVRVIFNIGSSTTRSGTAGSWATTSLNPYYSATGSTNLIATVSASIKFAGVQFEGASSATAFEWRDYGEELRLCQRFFYKSGAGDMALAWVQAGNTVWAVHHLPVSMAYTGGTFGTYGTVTDNLIQSTAGNHNGGSWAGLASGYNSVMFSIAGGTLSETTGQCLSVKFGHSSATGITVDASI